MKKHFVSLAPILFFLLLQNFNQSNTASDILFQEFKDNPGTKGAVETRQVFKTKNAYRVYFGHNPPPEVNFSTDWVFFYSAGTKTTSGYTASVKKLEPSQTGMALKITASLTGPDSACRKKSLPYKAFVFVKFRPPAPTPQYVFFYQDNKIIDCRESDLKANDSLSNSSSKTDKWVVNRLNAKGGTGKLFVTLPTGVEWNLAIYKAGSDKIISNTMMKTAFVLAPGNYDLEINHIWIKGVPVEKGNTTRLKTGVLHIQSANEWTLYDQLKEKVLINSLSPEKRGLPVGKYKLTILGQDYDIEIKDGATLVM